MTWLAYSHLGVAKTVQLTTQPAGALAGIAFSTQPVGRLVDGSGVLSRATGVTVTASKASGTGTLSGTLTAVTVEGVFTFTNLKMDTVTSAVTLQFASSGLTSAVSSAFNVTQPNTTIGAESGSYAVTGTAAALSRTRVCACTPGSYLVTGTVAALGSAATQIVVTTHPAGAVTGVAFTTQPVVRLRNAASDNVLESGVTVTAYLSAGSGTLGGTKTATTDASGIATFTNLSITGTGSHTVSFYALMSQVQTVWSDDVETDRSASYFEVNTAGGAFSRASVDGSMQWRAVQSGAGPEFGNLKLGIGRTPSGVTSVGPSGVDFGRVTMECDIYHSANNLTNSQDKCLRMSVFADSSWSQAACAHIWSDGGTVLKIDPVTSVVNGSVTAVGWNDFAHFTWTGSTAGTTTLFGATATTQRRLKVVWTLDAPGQANGTVQMYLDNVLELQQTGLTLRGTYTAYGINAVHWENYRTSGVTTANNRMYDDLAVSGQAQAVVAATSLTVAAGGTGGGANEPSGMTQAFSEAWNTTPNGRTGSQEWITDGSGTNFTIVTDATAPVSPGNVLQLAYPSGFGAGFSPARAYYAESGGFPSNTGTLYMRVRFKLSSNWTDMDNAGTKFCFIRPVAGEGGGSGAQTNNYINLTSTGSLDFGFATQGPSFSEYYTGANLAKGVWHDMEFVLTLGTSGSANDGTAKVWANGTQILNASGIKMLYNGQSATSGWKYLFFDPTYGGGTTPPNVDINLQIDHWYASVK